mgnify:CR=1 FL=1
MPTALDLHAAQLVPFLVQDIGHVPAQLPAFRGHKGDPDPVGRHLVDGRLESLHIFIEILLVDLIHLHMIRILRDHFPVKFQDL